MYHPVIRFNILYTMWKEVVAACCYIQLQKLLAESE